MKKIYTLGYTLFGSGDYFDVDQMFSVLKQIGITHLIDVRSVPYSQYTKASNYDSLKSEANKYDITYGHIPELGARAESGVDVFSRASEIFPEDRVFPISKSKRPEKDQELYGYEEIVDFEKMRSEQNFLQGIKRVVRAYEQGHTLALMCSEKYPHECHRYFLITRVLESLCGDWLEVLHITGEDATISLSCDVLDSLGREVDEALEAKGINYLQPELLGEALIDKFEGDTLEEKRAVYCDRYWNLLHGWKRKV